MERQLNKTYASIAKKPKNKDINEILERLAVQKALYETNYEIKNDRIAG